MNKEVRKELRIRRFWVVLEYARLSDNTAKACREFNVNRSSFYVWKKAFENGGMVSLRRKKPIANNHPRKLSQEVVDKILYLRKEYKLGPERIKWYLERYHGIKTSQSSVYRTLIRHGMRKLPKNAPRKAIHTKRYAKKVPGHHVQVDVKFLSFKNGEGQNIRRFQYTAIDDATRIRALKIYQRHNQKNAIDFINYVM